MSRQLFALLVASTLALGCGDHRSTAPVLTDDPALGEDQEAVTTCTKNSQCNDADACTRDRCNKKVHSCVNKPIAGCCLANSDCSDGNVCTSDTCNLGTHTCTFSAIAACCTSDTACNDSDVCTSDT